MFGSTPKSLLAAATPTVGDAPGRTHRRARRRFLAGGAAALLLAGVGLPVGAARADIDASPALFGFKERRLAAVGPSGKLKSVIDPGTDGFGGDADGFGAGAEPSQLRAWKRFLDKLRGLPIADQLAGVNEYVNLVPFVSDAANYGVPDHWATLKEFFKRGGDCEDYAIAKYASLKALSFPGARLRIVVLHDQRQNLGHAVLAAYVGAEILILDNQSREVLTHDRIAHYRPIYSTNETTMWIHTA